MKKVDVITRHAIGNYGSILQAYATQIVFEKLGYDCEIIDYQRKEEKGKEIWKNLLRQSPKWNSNIITRLIYRIIQEPNYVSQYKKFSKYRKELLKETKEYNTIEELKNDLPDADIFCTGSDQVWGKIGNSIYDEAYFLKFVPKDKKCIAYSASFGKKDNNHIIIEKLPELLCNYSKIMVREDTAVETIEKSGINNVEQVLDPTLLLNEKDWNKIVKENNIKKDYILIYQLHDNREFEIYAKEFAKRKKMKLLRITPSLSNFFKCGKTIYMPTPQEYLGYIKNARYIITDSFHGTVFSLIFNKQFIDICPKRGATRMESILRNFGLEDRLVKSYDDFSIGDRIIDYKIVNRNLEKQREDSILKLKEALEDK